LLATYAVNSVIRSGLFSRNDVIREAGTSANEHASHHSFFVLSDFGYL